MTVTAKCAVEAKYMEAAETTQYTAPVRCIIDKCTITPPTGAASAATMKIVPSGGTAGASNIIMQPKTFTSTDPTYTCPEMVGQILNAGDFISTLGTVASSLVLRISVREIS